MKQKQSQKRSDFYDDYHGKNDEFHERIGKNNFTYFYLIKAISYIYERVSPTRVLDIGCGVGTLVFYLSDKSSSIDGFDISKRAIAIANNFKNQEKNKKVNFHNSDVRSEAFKAKYDLVLCTEVIEHLESDGKMLLTISNALTKGGYLLLSTPSINAPLFRLGFLKKFDREVGHLRRYEMDALTTLIKKSGLTIEKTYKVEGVLRNSLFTLPFLGQLIRFIKGPLIPIFHWFDQVSASLFGESDLIVIARKP